MRQRGIVLFCVLAITAAACAQNPFQDVVLDCQDDGIFCNGIERLIDGQCFKVPAAPCDDGVDCTLDTCDEATKTCTHTLVGDCAVCMKKACTANCTARRCGSDGCGGSCGGCGAGLGCTPTGTCVPLDGVGTCARPRPLAVLLGGDKLQVIHGDTTQSIHQLTPTCSSTSNAAEDVYTFTLTAPTGIEATSHDYDTVLYLRKDYPGRPGSGCLDNSPAATVACNDDSAPPGDTGSRVTKLLGPGTYYLIVTGFDGSQFGPYTLKVKFIAGCVPNCDGQYCGGSDGCGGTCGTCAAGLQCGPDLRCRPFPCKPVCTNVDGSLRTCGDNRCLGVCGYCPTGQLCVPRSGSCAAFPVCDHASPTCSPGCAAGSFCGSDCACHKATDPLPDLVINTQRLKDELLFDYITVDQNSCSLVEQCVGGLGLRRLLRISVEAINQGQAPLNVMAPDLRPDLSHFSACHGHYHFNGFASYGLLDLNGKEVIAGLKLAYCMEDTVRVMSGPNIGCTKLYSCANQGIQAGWSDLYGNSLDCQWLDITGVPAGDYQIRVTLNPDRVFQEVTTDNNTAVVPVHIAPP